MFLALVKYFLINASLVAEGFGLALLLREQYRLREQERQEAPEEESDLPEPEPPFSEPSDTESETPLDPSSVDPVTVLEEALLPHSPSKVDEIDDTLLPKEFKAESILKGMRDPASPLAPPDVTNGEDFAVMPHESRSAADRAFDDDDEEDAFPPSPSEPGPLEFEPTDEAASDGGISPLAAELLGKDFDFRSMVNPSAEPDESDEPVAAEITELGDDAYRTESGFLTDGETVRESMSWQLIESTFDREMVEALFIEPDRSTDQVFTMDSPPMLVRRRKKTKSA